MDSPAHISPAAAVQLLSFVLDGETFAIRIDQVREILDRTDMTRIPRMPAYMRGALNVRGAVVPVVDLRVKFGLPAVDPTPDTCVLLIEVSVDGESTVLGALVDSVRDVFEVAPENLSEPPKMGAKLDTEYMEAIVHHDEQMAIVLRMDRVLSTDEIITLRDSVADKPAKPSARPSGPRRKAVDT